MFKKTLTFNVNEKEAIDFCRILGKYGFHFNISRLRNPAGEGCAERKSNYRTFTVFASKRQAYALYEELSIRREEFV